MTSHRTHRNIRYVTMTSHKAHPKPSDALLDLRQLRRLPGVGELVGVGHSYSPGGAADLGPTTMADSSYRPNSPQLPYWDLHVRGGNRPEWGDDDVNDVIRRYLNLSTHEPHSELHIPPPCECCRDVNQLNSKKRFQSHVKVHTGAARSPPPIEPQVPPDWQTELYRSESPDLTVPGEHSSASAGQVVPLESTAGARHRSMYITQDARPDLYSYAGLGERSPKRVAAAAGCLVEASARYAKAMDKLNQTVEKFT